MTLRLNGLVYASAFALAAIHCGGSSTPESKTPAPSDRADQQEGASENSAPDSKSSGTTTGDDPSADATTSNEDSAGSNSEEKGESGRANTGTNANSSGTATSETATSSPRDTTATNQTGAASRSGSAGNIRPNRAISGARGSAGSETTSDERMPVAGRDEPDMGPNASHDHHTALNDAQVAGVMEFVNNAEIQQAQLARSKSKNSQVVSVATMIMDHHTQAKQQQDGLRISSTSSPLLQKLSSEGQQTLAKLREETGQDFDRAYLQAQIDQHQAVLDTIDRQLLPSTKNAQLRSQVQNIKPTIVQHLQAARSALTAIDNGQGSQGASDKGASAKGSSEKGASDKGTNSTRSGTRGPTKP